MQPFVGSEPQQSLDDGFVHDRATRGVRFTAGYIVRVPDGRSENRWGFATGFGF